MEERYTKLHLSALTREEAARLGAEAAVRAMDAALVKHMGGRNAACVSPGDYAVRQDPSGGVMFLFFKGRPVCAHTLIIVPGS